MNTSDPYHHDHTPRNLACNAFAAYGQMEHWDPSSRRDLLAAHGLLMEGLADDAGRIRSGGVGIFQGKGLVRMAPGAERVPMLMKDLLSWLRTTKEHPLVAGCLLHYELEFIHPFSDGNGRILRLWQTRITRRWHALLGYLPVETVVRGRPLIPPFPTPKTGRSEPL